MGSFTGRVREKIPTGQRIELWTSSRNGNAPRIFNRSLLVVDEPLHRDSTPGCALPCPDLLPDVQIVRKYCRGVFWASVKHSGQEVCVSASSDGFTPWVFRYVRCVIQSSRPGENLVSSRMIPQAQQTGSNVGGMNVSLPGAEGFLRVVRIMVFSIDIKHLISLSVGDGVFDTGL